MLNKGPAKKVTIYVNEETRHHAGPLYEAILTFLLHKGVAGATASRCLSGFGAHQQLHINKSEELPEHLPIRIEFVETAEKVEEVLPGLYDMVTDGLFEVQDTVIVKAAMKERRPAPTRPHEAKTGKAILMRVYLGEADRWHERPLYEAIVERLRMMQISGVTVHRGILGYGAKGHTHKQSFLHLSRDLPIMLAIVDVEPKVREAAEALESMIEDGLIVMSDVEVIRFIHSQPQREESHGTQPVG